MRRVGFTTEDTGRREKSVFTTEAQRHRDKNQNSKGEAGRISRCLPKFLFKSALCLCVSVVTLLSACSRKPDPNTLVMIIESSPINLDPRVGVDGQSQRIDELLFDSLLRHDEHFNLQPELAERWEIPIR